MGGQRGRIDVDGDGGQRLVPLLRWKREVGMAAQAPAAEQGMFRVPPVLGEAP